MKTRKQHRRAVVLARVAAVAYRHIEAAHRPPAEANYCSIMFSPGGRVIRRTPNTLLGWMYADTLQPLGA